MSRAEITRNSRPSARSVKVTCSRRPASVTPRPWIRGSSALCLTSSDSRSGWLKNTGSRRVCPCSCGRCPHPTRKRSRAASRSWLLRSHYSPQDKRLDRLSRRMGHAPRPKPFDAACESAMPAGPETFGTGLQTPSRRQEVTWTMIGGTP